MIYMQIPVYTFQHVTLRCPQQDGRSRDEEFSGQRGLKAFQARKTANFMTTIMFRHKGEKKKPYW